MLVRVMAWLALRRLPGGIALVIPILAAACASAAPSPSGSITGIGWVATEIADAGGALAASASGVVTTAGFEAGELAGNTGCNAYTAPYTINGDEISIGAIAATQRACPGAAGRQETDFLAALGRSVMFTVDANRLALLDAQRRPTVRFEPDRISPLTGTNWRATGVNNGFGGVAAVPAELDLTAVFATDGTVSGSGGCNQYNGPYLAEGSTLSVGPLASTMRACPQPAMDQEALFLTSFQKAASFEIAGRDLRIEDGAGATLVDFVAE